MSPAALCSPSRSPPCDGSAFGGSFGRSPSVNHPGLLAGSADPAVGTSDPGATVPVIRHISNAD